MSALPAGCMNHSEVSALPAGCMNQSEVSALPAGFMNQSEVSVFPGRVFEPVRSECSSCRVSEPARSECSSCTVFKDQSELSALPVGCYCEGGSTRLTISGEGALLGGTRWRLGGRHPQLLRVRHYGRCDGLDLLSHRRADFIE